MKKSITHSMNYKDMHQKQEEEQGYDLVKI